jgi:hypothetical protein
MGGEIARIEQRLTEQRQELGENLETLATRARALTDWRAQVEAHPLLAVGVAAGSGILLAALLTPRRRRSSAEAATPPSAARPASALGGLLGEIRVGLSAIAATRAVEYIAEAIPAFKSHLREGPDRDGS